mmetsp:Transcript_17188/g.39710  ORF Transcript_17188/g.39710 Transcript_17188/m.39710 type:complete len:94 (-) Transcript_17188:366-647(-)
MQIREIMLMKASVIFLFHKAQCAPIYTSIKLVHDIQLFISVSNGNGVFRVSSNLRYLLKGNFPSDTELVVVLVEVLFLISSVDKRLIGEGANE